MNNGPYRRVRSVFLPGFVLLCGSVALSWSTQTPADVSGTANAAKLFEDVSADQGLDFARTPVNPRVKRQRRARVDLNRVRGATLRLNLFDDTDFIARRSRLAERRANAFVWSGELTDKPGSEVRLAVSGNALSGTVRVDDALYRVRRRDDAEDVVIQEFSARQPLPEHPPVVVDEAALAAAPPVDADPASATADGSIIDIMVVYTPAARQAEGGRNALRAAIDLAIAETNEAYQRSGIDAQLNLVHTAEIGYTESGDMGLDLQRLRQTDDGHMDAVHGWRDTYGADLVSLIEVSSDYCGIAYVMQQVSVSFSPYGFGVVYNDCLTGFHVFAHEVGHNQGSAHDRANANTNGAFPYSFGYHGENNAFRTVMAYNCPGGCMRIQNFSNPNVFVNGLATGVDENVDPDRSADNVRSINNTRTVIANLRSTVVNTPPAAPLQLTASVRSADTIDLNWSDQANDETGFRIQRSLNSNQWSQIATLPANMENFSDTGLNPGTTYYYRVRAYNSVGNSVFSNIASGTTDVNQGSGTIGDRVWHDADRDGIQDSGETGAAGVRINLRACNAGVQTSTQTDADGSYLFTDLVPGEYQIEFIMPSGFSFSPQLQGGRGFDSDADPATGLSRCYRLSAGQVRPGVDAGLVSAASGSTSAIGDLVWNDLNGDGQQSFGERGLAGVLLELRECGGAILGTTQSDANGHYVFDNLSPGKYRVKTTLPTGFAFSPKGVGQPGKNSDADPGTGLTQCHRLNSGQSRVGIDVGLVPQPGGSAALGDRVWRDSNANGIQDAGEPGLNGAVVKLRRCDGALLGTTQSAGGGAYQFAALAAGNYQLEFLPPDGFVLSPTGHGAGGQDSDPDPATGLSTCRTLVAGQVRVGIDAGMHR